MLFRSDVDLMWDLLTHINKDVKVYFEEKVKELVKEMELNIKEGNKEDVEYLKTKFKNLMEKEEDVNSFLESVADYISKLKHNG